VKGWFAYSGENDPLNSKKLDKKVKGKSRRAPGKREKKLSLETRKHPEEEFQLKGKSSAEKG